MIYEIPEPCEGSDDENLDTCAARYFFQPPGVEYSLEEWVRSMRYRSFSHFVRSTRTAKGNLCME